MRSVDRIGKLQKNLPREGLFQGKKWQWSDRPLTLGREEIRFLETLGRKLHVFLQAAERIYRASVDGKAPAWVSEWLDLGKPEEIVRLGFSQKTGTARILRPDLIRTENGWALTEIDSVPGGIGLTAWLQEQ